jgi:asparagine synthase (glutamine-hydrolysing)
MCGFAGVYSLSEVHSDSCLRKTVEDMTDSLTHRGPDERGVWSSTGVALGHRRLSIIDFSNAGSQPMVSSDGRWVIVFNGEIYNAPRIKRSLPPSIVFRGHSDTEILLESIAISGVETTLNNIDGMFAIAVYDTKENSLYLARDRFGEKPLFYSSIKNRLIFGSELKALHACSWFDAEISVHSVELFLKYRSIPAPYSIYEGVFKILPGQMVTFRAGQADSASTYWKPTEEALTLKRIESGRKHDSRYFEHLFESSVRSRMISDAPVGVFLSGGIDSSLVAAVMQKFSDSRVDSFSIGFDESSHDESYYSSEIAKLIGTNHTPITFKPDDALRILPNIAYIYDEPIASESSLPLVTLCEVARSKVKVALAGEGADELFCGYPRYNAFGAQAKYLEGLPDHFRKPMFLLQAALASGINNWSRWEAVNRQFPKLRYFLGDQAKWRAICFKDLPAGYRAMRSAVSIVDTEKLLKSKQKNTSFIHRSDSLMADLSPIMQAMMVDTEMFLPDVLLARLDRSSMASSLEVRAPFLSEALARYTWALDDEQRLQGGAKYPLRELLSKYLPSNLIDRPKKGLGWPIGMWLRGPLRPWAEELLNESIISRQGLLNSTIIKKMWMEHLSGKSNHGQTLWTILMLQAWLIRGHPSL